MRHGGRFLGTRQAGPQVADRAGGCRRCRGAGRVLGLRRFPADGAMTAVIAKFAHPVALARPMGFTGATISIPARTSIHAGTSMPRLPTTMPSRPIIAGWTTVTHPAVSTTVVGGTRRMAAAAGTTGTLPAAIAAGTAATTVTAAAAAAVIAAGTAAAVIAPAAATATAATATAVIATATATTAVIAAATATAAAVIAASAAAATATTATAVIAAAAAATASATAAVIAATAAVIAATTATATALIGQCALELPEVRYAVEPQRCRGHCEGVRAHRKHKDR